MASMFNKIKEKIKQKIREDVIIDPEFEEVENYYVKKRLEEKVKKLQEKDLFLSKTRIVRMSFITYENALKEAKDKGINITKLGTNIGIINPDIDMLINAKEKGATISDDEKLIILETDEMWELFDILIPKYTCEYITTTNGILYENNEEVKPHMLKRMPLDCEEFKSAFINVGKIERTDEGYRIDFTEYGKKIAKESIGWEHDSATFGPDGHTALFNLINKWNNENNKYKLYSSFRKEMILYIYLD